jgi:thymidylate synthase (FAD)
MNSTLTYDDLEIEILQSTFRPHELVAKACALTQKQDFINVTGSKNHGNLIKYLFTANHTSPFEHAYITFLISNVSRSFLAQITRHRMGSFTSASQHYQRYDNYPNILDPQMLDLEEVGTFLEQANAMYSHLIANAIPKEEARQILPNAKGVNIIWTVNARSLLNLFNQRLCKRNVKEMLNFAQQLHIICIKWFPDLFKHASPDCTKTGSDGYCTQGHMQADVCKKAGIKRRE